MSYLDIVKLRQKKFGVSRSPTKNIDGVGVGGEKIVFSGFGVKKVDSAGHYRGGGALERFSLHIGVLCKL
jgi:hypothetical protein